MNKPPKPEGRTSAPRFHKKKMERRADAPEGKALAELPFDTLKKLGRDLIDGGERAALQRDLEKGTDRTAAIIAASLVEHLLENTILIFLPRSDATTTAKLLSREGALNGFFSKNFLGYAMGIYNKNVLSDLEAIREIRNNFAHSAKPINFETDEILKHVKKLSRQKPDDSFLQKMLLNRAIYLSTTMSLESFFIAKYSIRVAENTVTTIMKVAPKEALEDLLNKINELKTTAKKSVRDFP